MTWISALELSKRRALQRVYAGTWGERVRKHIEPDDVDFGMWMMLADLTVMRELEVGIFDLPAGPWRERFEAGLSPGDVACEAMGEGINEPRREPDDISEPERERAPLMIKVNLPPVAVQCVLDGDFARDEAWLRINKTLQQRSSGPGFTYAVEATTEDLVDLGNYLAGVADVLDGMSREERGFSGGQELRGCKQALVRITRKTGWAFDPYTFTPQTGMDDELEGA